MNYAKLFNRVSRARKPSEPSTIEVITDLLARRPPSLISLADGAPNPNLFPFESVKIKLRDGSSLSVDEAKMTTALQYGPTQGYRELLDWLRDLQVTLHNPPLMNTPPEQGGMDLCISLGSQDAVYRVMEMIIEPSDNVVLDCPTYSGTLAILRPLGCNLLAVETDADGMKPDSLRAMMSRWRPEDSANPECKIPRLIYIIPNGVNPTGASLPLERRQEIYEIARKYGLLILEDDPYYHMQFREERIPSFLSMDVDGRVIRVDSFSKVMSSGSELAGPTLFCADCQNGSQHRRGMRVGFVTAAKPLIDHLVLHMMVSVMHTPMISQVFISEQLKSWGVIGFMEHANKVCQFYLKQRDCMLEAANKHLTGLAEWDIPAAGMFIWFKLKGIKDSKKLIEQKAMAKEVMLVPGSAFMLDDTQPCSYVRASFSVATPDQIDLGIARFADLIREELKAQ